MSRIVKIGLILLFFFCLAADLFAYTAFSPEQLQPAPNAAGVATNQIFVYRGTKYKGYLMNCVGKPTLSNPEKGLVEIVTLSEGDVEVMYAKKSFYSGETTKSGFKLSCNFGLIFLDPKLSFHLFDTSYSTHGYNIESRTYTREELEAQLKAIPSDLEYITE